MNRRLVAAGILLFTREQPKSFLLLKHQDRWDLPKGHAEQGEELLQTALRETQEETGIPAKDIAVDPNFRFELEYPVVSKRFGNHQKQVTYFLGFVPERRPVLLTEHPDFRWFTWPASKIQVQTIDPLLEAVKRYWDDHPDSKWLHDRGSR